jgi:serine phosphatase RsbU (regulator of sigma subunit)
MTMLTFDRPDSESSVVNMLAADSALAGHEVNQDSTIGELFNANRRLHILYDMFRSFGTQLKEDELLDNILKTLFRIFADTDRGFIILRDRATGELVPKAMRLAHPDSDKRVNMSRTLLEFVMDRKQAVLTRDAMKDDRFADSDSIMSMEVRSAMCAPLMSEQEVLGFISLDTRRVTASYDESGLALLAGIANQASLAIANARLHGDLVAQERINQDLQNARRIQHSFLPKGPPLVAGYEFAHWYCAALEVGGDFYDFIEMPDGKLCVVVGDVSGKGIQAALMMAKTTSHVRFQAAAGLGAAAMMKQMNRAITEAETELFVTVLLMVVDCDEHEVTLASAGHLPPMLRRAEGDVEVLQAESGFPIGLLAEAEFPEHVFRIRPGDRLCLFTDGVTEAMDAHYEQYGEERLLETLRTAPPDADEIVRAVRESVNRHVNDAVQSDDVTLVCFGPLDPDAPTHRRREAEAEAEAPLLLVVEE